MREWYTASRYEIPAGANATDDMIDNAARRPEHAAFARKVGEQWQPVTSADFASQVMSLAAGLIAAGVNPGDRIGLMSGTSYEWALCDFAILTAGAVTVPIYETSSVAQVEWILRDSGATAVFVGNEELRATVENADVTDPKQVWLMDDEGLGALSLGGSDVGPEQVEQRRRAVTADQLASIVYTSGTTGRPKGCMITHRNLLAEIHNVVTADGVSATVLTEQDSLLLFLPMSHILARVVQFAAFHQGAQVAHLSDLTRVAVELAAYQPTIVLAVPRVFEKLYNTAQRKAAESGRIRVFDAAARSAIAYSRALDAGAPSVGLRIRRRIFDRLVYTKLRAAMGGRVRHTISGGAPLGATLGHLLRGAGVHILEGYGLTETTAAITLNLPTAQRIGSVGRPLPGCAIRIADDGEVLVKGDNVTVGYWRNERATHEAIDEKGWLHTGDVGQLDDGFLTITGRTKDIIVTATGKNIAPAFYEDRLRAHWLIDQCVLVGDRKPYLAALVSLDPQAFTQWKQDRGQPAAATLAELRNDPELTATVQAAIDEVNKLVSQAESIRQFGIVPDEFTIGDELTPTQKVRREYVLAKHADEVAALYRPPASLRG
ncbi:MAG TPA: long-chain fatty acid--CoA ligase [Jiangellaceae bacterium]|nr:long-chain fatty acid--CoA ligase [Jiangellaceae bacterium]